MPVAERAVEGAGAEREAPQRGAGDPAALPTPMAMPLPWRSWSADGGGLRIQRKCNTCGDDSSCPTCATETPPMPAMVQPRLSLSHPGDEDERAADSLAERVLRAPQSRPDPDAPLAGAESSSLPAPLDRLGGGQPLPASVRGELEPRFGASFERVRVHTDGAAAGLARDWHAEAFTVGPHIAFADGRYSPGLSSGRSLLTHELAHVAQQRPLAPTRVQRRWDAAASDCSALPAGRTVDRVVVEQEEPQSATIHWSDGTVESDITSTGKGHCCVDPTTNPNGVAGTVAESNTADTNLTPISTTTGFPIINRVRNHSGVEFWSEINHGRAIALHEYFPVDGTALSHGCIRLNHDLAVKIFCGSVQNRTLVEVRGFARPRCSWAGLQAEWLSDFRTAAKTHPDGDTTQGEITEARKELRDALGRPLPHARDFSALTVADIPRCGSTGAQRTSEEAMLDNTQAGNPTMGPQTNPPPLPTQILAGSGFDSMTGTFVAALNAATTVAAVGTLVDSTGLSLWNRATTRAQAGNTDDRPLYWERLELTRALRQWQPAFAVTPAERTDLMNRLEASSRGRTSATFSNAAGVKRILISGFDPFQLDQPGALGRANPSGAAVLALDGLPLTNGTVHGEVQGVIFPVRFADFDAGTVESFFGQYLNGTRPVDMIMTISQGGRSNAFAVEDFAGRRRSSTATDNLGQTGGGTPTAPVVPAAQTTGPEFLPTTLNKANILGTLGQGAASGPVQEIVPPATTPTPAQTPTAGSTAVEGSGGGYLSNEIFYRVAALRRANGATVPMGHLHTPLMTPPAGGAVSTPAFVTARDNIVNTIRQILINVLPTLP